MDRSNAGITQTEPGIGMAQSFVIVRHHSSPATSCRIVPDMIGAIAPCRIHHHCWLTQLRLADRGCSGGFNRMPRIFLSHPSRDNRRATALRQWLIEQDPQLAGEIFLDLTRDTGIRSGVRWKDALRQASARCEAVKT
jgi:hypothetical protein